MVVVVGFFPLVAVLANQYTFLQTYVEGCIVATAALYLDLFPEMCVCCGADEERKKKFIGISSLIAFLVGVVMAIAAIKWHTLAKIVTAGFLVAGIMSLLRVSALYYVCEDKQMQELVGGGKTDETCKARAKVVPDPHDDSGEVSKLLADQLGRDLESRFSTSS
eukprot:3849953-Amphidinium_carterae.1